MITEHLQRVKESIANVYTMGNLSQWISNSTKYEGKRFSYEGREYQPTIIDDPAKTLLVIKCAQVGLSEIFARWALASVVTQDNFTTIYTFPAATDAELFSKSRLMPIIDSSKVVKHSMSRTVNSVELKQFGVNSFLYTRGTYSETGALSVPADLIIHDEYDRSDMANVSAYVSRLQAKPTKMRRIFSTPTVAKYGIDAECQTARRKKQVWTCSHCRHKFLPTYHDNIVIPGYSGKKEDINKHNLESMRWREAKLLCPKCGQIPETGIQYREWVVENNDAKFDAISYNVSPFCAPSFITAPYLVKVSTEFNKWSEFCNQALGETSEDAQDMLVESDVRAMHSPNSMDSSDVHFLGADMGLTCHIMIGRKVGGKLIVVHREKVFYTDFEERRRILCSQYRVVTSVHDLFPYTDIITRITSFDPNAYGAIYVEKKSTESHTIKDQEANPEEGKLNVRSAMVNRNIALDELMAEIKAGSVLIHGVDDELVQHLLDMKRIQKFMKDNTMKYVWEKTDGHDHWHHTLLYLYIATKLRATAGAWTALGAVPFVSSFVSRQNVG
jgi:hypothetical protein